MKDVSDVFRNFLKNYKELESYKINVINSCVLYQTKTSSVILLSFPHQDKSNFRNPLHRTVK